MKIKNELTLTIGSNCSKSIIEKFLNIIVSSFLSELNPTEETLNDIKSITNEAINNCIKHAYPGDFVGKISYSNRNEVKITIRDNGVGIENVKNAMISLNSIDFNKYSGLGFSIMKAFADEVKVKSNIGYGTTVTLIKKINNSEKETKL